MIYYIIAHSISYCIAGGRGERLPGGGPRVRRRGLLMFKP